MSRKENASQPQKTHLLHNGVLCMIQSFLQRSGIPNNWAQGKWNLLGQRLLFVDCLAHVYKVPLIVTDPRLIFCCNSRETLGAPNGCKSSSDMVWFYFYYFMALEWVVMRQNLYFAQLPLLHGVSSCVPFFYNAFFLLLLDPWEINISHFAEIQMLQSE